MKLPISDRQKLYESKGKPIEVSWPSDAPEARKGKRYTVYGDESGERLFSLRIEGTKRRGEAVRAIVRLDNDPIRVMPGLSGQRNVSGDYEDEPERVHEDYEKLLVAEALQKTTLLGAEHRQREKTAMAEAKADRGKQAKEYAVRQQKRMDAA